MTSKPELRAYFKRKAAVSEGSAAKRQIANPKKIIPATESINKAENKLFIDEIEKSTARKNHYNNISKQVRIEVRRYALDHSTKEALEKFSK